MKSVRIAFFAALLCTLPLGCAVAPRDAAPPLNNVQFQGTERMPARVDNLKGTALLGIEAEMSKVDPQGSYFVLLSPTDPQKGVLVRTNLPPDKLKALESTRLNVSGPVRALEHPELVAHFQETYSLTLTSTPDGKPQVIELEGKLELPPATASENEGVIDLGAPGEKSDGAQ
ncbi:MAG: hypothetical protein AB1758_36675 [Candidatus Eremiobacterota bacterium]